MTDVVQQEMVTPQVEHQGRNTVCCRGKCFINAQPLSFAKTLFLINVPVALTLALTYEHIFVDGFVDSESLLWILLTLVLMYLVGAVNYNMMGCVLTDPGILPSRHWPNEVSSRYDTPKDHDFYTWNLQVNQRTAPHLFKFTFCKTCQVFQPARCNHCPQCNTCVLELDHHCPYLGTCLGLRNYHTFYWFLLHLVVLLIYVVGFIGCYMWRLAKNRTELDEEEDLIFTWPEWIVFPIICILEIAILTFVLPLFKDHQCVITTEGRTTYEIIYGTYSTMRVKPHKRGGSCSNFCQMVCCAKRVLDSRMNFMLQITREKKYFNKKQEYALKEHQLLDASIRADTAFADEHTEIQHNHRQIDMNECPEWQLDFRSRKQARGNLRTFQRVRRMSNPSANPGAHQFYHSEQRLINRGGADPYASNAVDPFAENLPAEQLPQLQQQRQNQQQPQPNQYARHSNYSQQEHQHGDPFVRPAPQQWPEQQQRQSYPVAPGHPQIQMVNIVQEGRQPPSIVEEDRYADPFAADENQA